MKEKDWRWKSHALATRICVEAKNYNYCDSSPYVQVSNATLRDCCQDVIDFERR